MSGRWMELVCSVDLQPTLEKVQDDQLLEFAEYSLLRDSADAKMYQLMASVRGRQGTGADASFDGEEELRCLQDASLRMAHLLQTSCLALRRLQLEYQDQRLAREALEHQLAYVQACLRRSMDSFGKF
ncbi:hypothetical protein KSS93_20670 [Pseudomonas xanthosomatis]|uniref:hypothetical protein n=1 Tax=Pseudomonas xanthosomatis TaxID=2842356 RepID=UPI001C3E6D67|nr:hypothetical protein [Pseudomonas xanthosomatis]QXH45268.1 hypothetical protein KSS93_20670 [Pseudomonas xanthosomatis]